MGKAAKGAKGAKGGKGAKGAEKGPQVVSPVAFWSGRARAVGALVGFAVAFWVSHRAGIGTTDAALRGLVGAVAFSLVAWLCALLVLGGLVRTAAQRPAEPEPPARAPVPGPEAGTPVP